MKRMYENQWVYIGFRWINLSDIVDKEVNLMCYDASSNEDKLVKTKVVKEGKAKIDFTVFKLSTGDLVRYYEKPHLLYVNHDTREESEIMDVKEESVRVFTHEYDSLLLKNETRTRKVMETSIVSDEVEQYSIELPEHYYVLTKELEDAIATFK